MPGRRFACAFLSVPLLVVQAWAAGHSVAPATSSVATTPPAYRAYASEQAEMLVRMTSVLARDIGDGDVAAAQNDYPMAHRYLARLAPALMQDRDLGRRMDASAEAFNDRERDPNFIGFHRIEHDLFASRSAQGLAAVAERLHDDALLLQQEIATQPMPPDVLVDAVAGMIEAVSARMPALGSESYAKTDLWDIEANLDAAQRIVTSLQPRVAAIDPLAAARVSTAFAEANESLARFQEGCGYRSFDALTRADKASLGQATTALARELTRLKSVPAID